MAKMQLEDIWSSIKDHLGQGIARRGHPFRLMTLATMDRNYIPCQRTVVLRAFDSGSMTLRFYTDTRSAKVIHLSDSPNCNIHFYHSRLRMQLSISAIATQVDENQVSEILENLNHTKDYRSIEAPGSLLNFIDDLAYADEIHFTAIDLKCMQIDFLQLSDSDHARVRFQRKFGWQGQWLVP